MKSKCKTNTLKTGAVFLLLTLLMITLFGCSPVETTTSSETAETKSVETTETVEQATEESDRDSVFVAISSIGNTLDAAVANFTNVSVAADHIYDRIIYFDENFELEPAVATAWEQVDDVTFIMTIGENYVFHNGDALTMDDIVFSVERMREIPRMAGVMNNIKSTEATGEQEVTITLVEPDSSTVRELLSNAHVLNKAYCESVGEDYANKPIGTGPYVVKSFTPGDKLELTAWEDYPFEKPAIKHITFKTIEEAANRFISIETREAQFAVIGFQDVARAEADDNIDVINQTSTNTSFISMNNKKAPFDNKNVRLAMAHATDKEGLAVVQGGATVIDSMTPSMFSTYYDSSRVAEYDLDKAKALLEEEGYNASNPLEFETWVYGGNSSVMEAFQASLKTIGVDMSIKNLEFGVFLEGMANGEYQMLAGSWNNTSGNPLSALENYWSGSFGSKNISFFENERCDELYDIAKATSDPDVIIDAAKEVQDIAAEESPIIPTFSNLAIFAKDKQLQGVRILPSSVYSFRKAYFE